MTGSITLHDAAGNWEPLADPDGFLARFANPADTWWQGDFGQSALEHAGPKGSDWLFISPAPGNRFYCYTQRADGLRAFATTEADGPDEQLLIDGRPRAIASRYLLDSASASQVARYFIKQDGLLLPVIGWESDGKPYWPAHE